MKLQVFNTEDGSSNDFNINKLEVFVGTSATNDVQLYHPSLSGRHFKIVFDNGFYEVQDLNSRTGTFVNGKRIKEKQVIKAGDTIEIGSYSLSIVLGTELQQRLSREELAKKILESKEGRYDESLVPIKTEIHQRLIAFLDLRRMNLRNIEDAELRSKTSRAVSSIMKDMADYIPSHVDRENLHKEMLDEVLGLGPIEDLINDPHITEIMVNGKSMIYIEIHGRLYLTSRSFASDESLLGIIERIVSPLGRRIDESSPMVDARLKDGSRINAIIPPLSLTGPVLTIRKFSREPFTGDKLVEIGTLTYEVIEFIKTAVHHRRNMVISGGTSTGKTTLLNVMAGLLPKTDRIITIEDSAELQLPQEHLVSLESRPANIQGKGEVTIRDLVRNSLRMRPDRIVVGEVRGGEALDMLQAMNTGHDGSLTTGHANSAYDFLRRLETMVLMAGVEMPIRVIREQIASAIHIIFQLMRFSDGQRRLVAVTEMIGLDQSGNYQMQDIFLFKQRGVTDDGQIIGQLLPTGVIPALYKDLQEGGLEVNTDIFKADTESPSLSRVKNI